MIAVVYNSKTGFTKRYAEAIAKRLNASATPLQKASANTLRGADTIIFGGRVIGNAVTGYAKLCSLAAKAGCKKLIVFGVGISRPTEKSLKLVSDTTNFYDEGEDKLFLLRGGVDIAALRGLDKFMLKNVRQSLEKKEDLGEEDSEVLSALTVGADFYDENGVEQIVSAALQISSDNN